MKACALTLLGVLVASACSVNGASKTSTSAACAFALSLGMDLTIERRDRVVDARLHDAALKSVAHLEARIEGDDEGTLFVTVTEGADEEGQWLQALLAGAMDESPRVRTIDIYLTAADFRAAVVPVLNQDLPPSWGLSDTARYKVLRRLGFTGAASLRFTEVGDDGENEVQVRLVMSRDPSAEAIAPAATTRLQ